MAQQKPKYDHYENALFLDDPVQANNNRRPRVCAPKIGTEPRMAGHHDNANPGPQYMYLKMSDGTVMPEVGSLDAQADSMHRASKNQVPPSKNYKIPTHMQMRLLVNTTMQVQSSLMVKT